MPTRKASLPRADAAACGIRLTVAVVAGGHAAAIEIDPGHCERLFRMTAYLAIRHGRLSPGASIAARLTPGSVRDRHGSVDCLDSCAVELLDVRRRIVARTEFPRAAFAAFAMARAQHLDIDVGAEAVTVPVAYSLHAVESAEPLYPVVVPALPPLSVEALTAAAVASGAPTDEWIATFMSAEVRTGLGELEKQSRAAGIEVAGRIHTRLGFDRERRCFARILDRLVISRQTHGTALTVVSTAASWTDFLAHTRGDGPQAPASVHTHLHLEPDAGGDGPPAEHLLAPAGTLRAASDPCISINDIVTHYTVFPDPLSAALIVSVFPDRHVVRLYGYTPTALLCLEPGYWALDDRGARAADKED
jgi:hypothetical protein